MEPGGTLPCPQDSHLFPILSQINPVHAVLSHLFHAYFNVNFQTTSMLYARVLHLLFLPRLPHAPRVSSSLIRL